MGSEIKGRILIVDDEALIRWTLEEKLTAEGYQVSTAENGTEAMSLFKEIGPDVVILDNKLPGVSGLVLLEEMLKLSVGVSIIMITAYGDVETAVKAMKLGAVDFVKKPFEYEEISVLVEHAMKARAVDTEFRELHRQYKSRSGLKAIIGESPEINSMKEVIYKVSQSDVRMVLIEGESGTGKDLVAQAIHYESNRFSKPFVAINCSALVESLLESELFGHEKGSFTDAKQRRIGQLESAENGTIFLDEIGDISPSTQVKLLRLLESRSFRRVGGNTEISLNACIVAATNRDLPQMLSDGTFRQDLYYRLKVIDIQIPPLRNRTGDVLVLVKYFMTKYNIKFRKQFHSIEPIAIDALTSYGWPGNVRQLKNVIERIVILEEDESIRFTHLPVEITRDQIREGKVEVKDFTAKLPPDSLYELEKNALIDAMSRSNGNLTQAARLLSISRDTMRYRIKKYGLE